MNDIIYILLVIGFLLSFIMIEIWLIKKSKEKFLELKQAYKELREAKRKLKNL